MEQKPQYPLGMQAFPLLREGRYVYVDKTAYVYTMTHASANYMFLSRPRRFGKSLLISTLAAYFEGRKELFQGLDIATLETEWRRYPVISLDMSTAHYSDEEGLKRQILYLLSENERKYGIKGEGSDANIRLANLITRLYEQTGERVVVLVDEYDSPLLDVIHEEETLPRLRKIMRNFYSPLKACGAYLRYVFLTGITKFSQLSIFSELNNIQNISLLPQYAGICGITREELETQLSTDINLLAAHWGKTREETIRDLVTYYDGYHFTWPSPDVFNPYSLINAFDTGRIEPYWFSTGTPAHLVRMLRKFKVAPQEIGGQRVTLSAFDTPTDQMGSIIPLLYQSGYITIKDYNPKTRQYTLDIPNQEVRLGLMESLLTNYMAKSHADKAMTLAGNLYDAFDTGQVDQAMKLLQDFLLTLPYADNVNYEGHYQQMLYAILSLVGHYVEVEVRTPTGRIDMVIRTNDTIYILELKLHQDAQTALQQINLKDYASRFALSGLPVVKIGISFDAKCRTIGSWAVEH